MTEKERRAIVFIVFIDWHFRSNVHSSHPLHLNVLRNFSLNCLFCCKEYSGKKIPAEKSSNREETMEQVNSGGSVRVAAFDGSAKKH